MSESKNVVVAGILDTKGSEVKYLADVIQSMGATPTILELSVGESVGWADIGLDEVLARVDSDVETVKSMERATASELVAAGAAAIVAELHGEGRLDGIIAMGGSMGSSIASRAMQALPVGVPKILLSTMASGDVSSYIGTKDIAVMYPIAEVGLNRVTRRVLSNAAGGIVGMVNAPSTDSEDDRPLVGAMMMGVTTPAVQYATQVVEAAGYDLMVNHAVGSGGRSMEELIEDGHIVGILDITTHEIADEMFGGILSAGPDRLTAAGLNNVPQVVVPSGLQFLNFGPRDTLPAKFEAQAERGERVIHVHNPEVTIASTTVGEMAELGRLVGEKLNRAIGPTALCVPMRGFGAYDVAGTAPELGWAEDGPGPFWIPDPENRESSLRALFFLRGLADTLDTTKDNIDVLVIDRHVNEPEFGTLLASLLLQMLDGMWKVGSTPSDQERVTRP